MRSVFGKPGFRGTAASMPNRNVAHSGKLLWAGIHAGLAVVAMGLLLGGCPQPEGRGGGSTDTYTVIFNADGGIPAPEVQTVAEGSTITEPAVPAKPGYNFIGWYKETALSTPWDFSTDTVTGNITLYAKWSTVTYTVTFNADDGIPAPEVQTVAEGSTITEPAVPAKPGYTFGGWFKDAALISPWNFSTDTVTVAITLYARWIPSYTVTFEANGGAPVPAAQTVVEDGKVADPADPAITGYALVGWYRDAGLTNPWDFDTDTVTADIILYAKWIRTYTVFFNANGGTPVPAIQTVGEGGKVAEPAAMTRDGYTFGGWYKEVAPTNQWDFTVDTVTADITFYAKWLLINTYTGEDISFKTVFVPGGITFPAGEYDSGTATVANAYEIGETEVTYELWHKVRVWAEGNGYSFYNNPGREGSSGTSQNTTPSTNKQEPVTMVNWYDVVVWLNALTEWVNAKTGNTLTPVYYYDGAYAAVAKNSDPDNFMKETGYTYASAYAKPGTTGFRLPSSNEWELAARWRYDETNTVSGYTNPWFTTGNSASGATADYNNATATGAVAWYGASKTQPVKGKAANGLGLYDMSGNVYEWCFDLHPIYIGYRFILGGGWYNGAGRLTVGVGDGGESTIPDYRDDGLGFRPARTAQ